MSVGEKKYISAPAWLMEFTANASESFVTAYYAASDSPQRGNLLPSLYLPNSSISWNGNPISGATQYKQWLETHPGSQHEIQSFDCHPLGPFDAYDQNVAPSLMLNVSGTVAHYTPESLATDQSNAPKSATSTGGPGGNSSGGASSKRKFNADAPIETYPRVFSQSFVLINGAGTAAEGGVPFVWMPSKNSNGSGKGSKNIANSDKTTETRTVAKYFIQADCFRFVG